MSHDSQCLDEHNDEISFDVHPVLEVVGGWAVTHFGLEWIGDTAGYAIPAGRLWEQDWEEHLAEKSWSGPYVGQALARARAWHAPRHSGRDFAEYFSWGGRDLSGALAVRVSPGLVEATAGLTPDEFRAMVLENVAVFSRRPA